MQLKLVEQELQLTAQRSQPLLAEFMNEPEGQEV
jgi:hypothetical protein